MREVKEASFSQIGWVAKIDFALSNRHPYSGRPYRVGQARWDTYCVMHGMLRAGENHRAPCGAQTLNFHFMITSDSALISGDNL